MESEGYIVVIAATGGGGHGWIGFEGGQHTHKKHQIQQKQQHNGSRIDVPKQANKQVLSSPLFFRGHRE